MHRSKATKHKLNVGAPLVPTSPFATPEQTTVFVMTTRGNFAVRRTIRATWASGHANVFFVVGAACHVPPTHRTAQQWLSSPSSWACNRSRESLVSNHTNEVWKQHLASEAAALQSELSKWNDVLELQVDDSYEGLPDKVVQAYRWGIVHTQSKWFVKVDDDCFMRVGIAANYLAQTFAQVEDQPVVIGNIVEGAPVMKAGKWKEHDHLKLRMYPPFPKGSAGHIVSRSVAQYIADHSDSLLTYQQEDVSLGMWMAESPLAVQWNNSLHMVAQEGGNCLDTTKFLIGHRISQEKMLKCYSVTGHESALATAYREKVAVDSWLKRTHTFLKPYKRRIEKSLVWLVNNG